MNRRRRVAGAWLRLGCVAGLALSTGCASYVANRARDAADIMTLTVGVGDGLKVQLGPVHLAAFRGSDLAGLRNGELFGNGNGMMYNEDKMFIFPLPRSEDWNAYRKELDAQEKEAAKKEGLVWKRDNTWRTNIRFGSSVFVQDRDYASSQRGKDIFVNCPGPVWAVGRPASYFSEIELAGGVLLCFRIGFNPGELLDFFLGWGGIDIYRDDL
jgi:hypothetical protein